MYIPSELHGKEKKETGNKILSEMGEEGSPRSGFEYTGWRRTQAGESEYY